MKNDTGKTVRSLLIAGVVVMAVSIMWPLLAEKYGTSKQTASNALQSETSSSIYHRLHRHQHQHQNQR